MPFFKKRPNTEPFPSNDNDEDDQAPPPAKPLGPLTLQSRIKRRPEIVSGEVADEAILVSPEQARVRMLNEVGSRLWALADGSLTLREMADVLVAEYDVTPELALADVLDFARELREAGLVDVM